MGAGGRVSRLDFAFTLPGHEELLLGAGCAVAQSLGVIACQDELDGTEEAHVEDWLLIGDQLANAVGDLYGAALELDHGHGDAVDVEDDVGPAFVAAFKCDLLGQGEVVLLGVIPVDQLDGVMRLAHCSLD